MTAAAQICHRLALTSQLRLEKQIQYRKLKNIASILSNAVLEFWSSVEVPRELEETNLRNNKVFHSQPSFVVFDGNGDHVALPFFFKKRSELCIYKRMHTHTYTVVKWKY